MASSLQCCAVLVAALLWGAPAHAAIIVGPDGKPIPRASDRVRLIGEAHTGACKVPPKDSRVVRFNLAPETKLEDATAWISSVTCKSFLVRDPILAEHGPVTMIAPERITPSEAYRLFLGALDSVGLTVEHAGPFERIVETAKVKTMRGVPIYDEDTARSVVEEPYITVLLRLQDLSPEEQARLLERPKGESCDCSVFAPRDTVVITDLRSNIERRLGRPIPVNR
jgi:hypothetical protein